MRTPFFVYGTLRPGQPNDRCWRDHAVAVADGAAYVEGYRLTANGSFPYAIPAPGRTTIGALIVPTADGYDEVLRRLDGLEGYPYHYDRYHVAVRQFGEVEGTLAYIYVPRDLGYPEGLPPVPGNDWSVWREMRYAGGVDARW